MHHADWLLGHNAACCFFSFAISVPIFFVRRYFFWLSVFLIKWWDDIKASTSHACDGEIEVLYNYWGCIPIQGICYTNRPRTFTAQIWVQFKVREAKSIYAIKDSKDRWDVERCITQEIYQRWVFVKVSTNSNKPSMVWRAWPTVLPPKCRLKFFSDGISVFICISETPRFLGSPQCPTSSSAWFITTSVHADGGLITNASHRIT